MTRSFLLIAVLVWVAACHPERATRTPTALVWSPDTLYVEPELIRDAADSAHGRDAMVRPVGVRAHAGLLYVADLASDRVAVLDSSGLVRRWIGTRGRGPGELYGLGRLAVHDGRLYVGEALNGRVSEFTLDGAFVRTLAAPFAAGAIAVRDARVLTAARDAPHFAALLDTADAPQLVLPRAKPRGRAARARWTAMPGHDLIVADSTGYTVFDQATLRVCRYANVHATADCTELPASLRQRLNEYRDARVTALESATGLQVNAAPVAKDMIQVGRVLAILLVLPELPIVFVDFDDGTLTPARIDPGALPEWARAARGFAWDGRSYVVVSDDGLGRLHINQTATFSPAN